jgi:hypothetical protein
MNFIANSFLNNENALGDDILPVNSLLCHLLAHTGAARFDWAVAM